MSVTKGALHVCERCGRKLFTQREEGAWGSSYKPEGWTEPLYGMLLCPECSKEWTRRVDSFLKDGKPDLSDIVLVLH